MYEIELMDGEIMWMNDRVIRTIRRREDGSFTITHFNETYKTIKSFKKL
jgi:hypothetical protein